MCGSVGGRKLKSINAEDKVVFCNVLVEGSSGGKCVRGSHLFPGIKAAQSVLNDFYFRSCERSRKESSEKTRDSGIDKIRRGVQMCGRGRGPHV